jgi:hypothetical protein
MPDQLPAEELYLAMIAYRDAVKAFAERHPQMASKTDLICNWFQAALNCFEFLHIPLGDRSFRFGPDTELFPAIEQELWIAGEHMITFAPETLFHEHKYSVAMTALLMHLKEASWMADKL